ncbi:MAG: hypothetical protein HY903_20850 [Deltaproteobacteria bacterium]|nr:hypothetical protein [Deltaproteobacteria bacterium]
MNRAVLLLVLLAAPVARATRVERASLESLVAGAGLVVLGHPLARTAFWDGGRILTRVTLAVDETWAGTPPAAGTLDVVLLGGIVGDLGQTVSGEARIPDAGLVVAALQQVEGRWRVLGMSQGLFEVRAERPGPPTVVRRLDGLAWLEDTAPAAFPERLDALRQRVMDLANAR